MQTIEAGDYVFAPDGSPVQVVGKSPVKHDDLWEVVTQDGCVITCSGDHLWGVYLDRKGPWRKYTTEQLFARQNGARLQHTKDGPSVRPGNFKPRPPTLPRHAAVQLPTADLPLDPYVLGVWLGDGNSSQAIITMADADAEVVRPRFEEAGFETTDQSTPMTFGVKGLRVILRKMGVLGKKHIPPKYLLGDIDQRIALLQGLMDTDGCAAKDGQLHFAQSDEGIIDSFRELLWSLGIRNTKFAYQPPNGSPAWKVYFHWGADAFFLDRKRSRCNFKDHFKRTISIRPTDRRGWVQCLEVASEDGLFLAGKGMVVTSNTKSEFASIYLPAYFLGRYPKKKIIQASHTAELAVTFGRKVRDIVGREDYRRLFPNTQLSQDSKAAGRWATKEGGEYFAIGVGGAIAGKGADLFVIDDPISEQEYIQGESNPDVYDKVMEWYEGGPRQRLQPGGKIIVVMCVAGDQRILMGDGTWRPIAEVVPGDEVYGFGEDKPVRKRVLAASSQGIDDIIEVTTRSTSLRVNRRHPILVVRGGLKKSAKTQVDVFDSRRWSLEWVQAGDLKPGDTVVTIKSTPAGVGHRPMNFFGSCQMTQKDYWLWGFMLGDGWLASSAARGDVGVCIAQSDKPSLDAFVLKTAQEVWGVAFQPTRYGYYRVDNRPLARWLRERGFISGARVKRLPEWVHRLRPCDKRSVLEGFFAADGWLRPSTRSRTFTVGLANRELLDDLRLLARTCGYKTTKIYSYTHTAQPPNSPKPFEAQHYSARFSDKWNRRELRSRYRHQSKYYRFEDVEAITDAGSAEVFDLTVEGAESFIAEGIVVHNTRWHKRDLTGQLVKRMQENPNTDRWKVVELPAIMPSGEAMWPEYWSTERLIQTKHSIPISKWQAQYQQEPTSEEGALIKREYWRDWTHGKPPELEAVLQSWDTAFSKGTRADYSACTTWGVFFNETDNRHQLILIDAIRGKWEFPELKERAKAYYLEWRPESVVIEARAAGMPLIYEFRQMDIPVQDCVVGRGTKMNPNDKISRVNAITDVFASKNVWAPLVKTWAQEVVEECAAFPAGEHDDYLDTVVMAVNRFRQGGWIKNELDDWDEEYDEPPRRYYW